MEMHDIEFRLKELSTRINNLKKFVTGEFSEIISNRFLSIEEELENLRASIEARLKAIEEKLRELEASQEDFREYNQALEKLSRRIDKSILRQLD
jgi:F0F1-type ATP synthase membrane subunit b/b'